MKGFKTKVIVVLCLLLALALLTGCTASEEAEAEAEAKKSTSQQAEQETKWPEDGKTITYLIPWGAGGGSDQNSRTLAPKVQEILGVPVVCEQKVGGAGAVGFTELHSRKPDGYTISESTSTISTLGPLNIIPYGYKDFEPVIGRIYDSPGIIVRADSGWDTVDDFIEYAKENPGKIKMATSSPGSIWWLASKSFQMTAGVDIAIIPSPGGGTEGVTNLLGGVVDAATAALVDGNAIEHIKKGKLKMLAAFGPDRLPAVPDVPTLKEIGYDVEVITYRGVLAPPGTPKEIVQKLHDAFAEAMKSEEYQKLLTKMNSVEKHLTPDEYKEYLKDEVKRYSEIIEKAGVEKK